MLHVIIHILYLTKYRIDIDIFQIHAQKKPQTSKEKITDRQLHAHNTYMYKSKHVLTKYIWTLILPKVIYKHMQAMLMSESTCISIKLCLSAIS